MQPKLCRHAIGAVMLIPQVHGKSLGGNTQRELLEAVRPLLTLIVSQVCPVEKELLPGKKNSLARQNPGGSLRDAARGE